MIGNLVLRPRKGRFKRLFKGQVNEGKKKPVSPSLPHVSHLVFKSISTAQFLGSWVNEDSVVYVHSTKVIGKLPEVNENRVVLNLQIKCRLGLASKRKRNAKRKLVHPVVRATVLEKGKEDRQKLYKGNVHKAL